MARFDSTRLWWLRGGTAARVMEALRHEPVPTDEDGIVDALARHVPDMDESTARKVAESLLEDRG